MALAQLLESYAEAMTQGPSNARLTQSYVEVLVQDNPGAPDPLSFVGESAVDAAFLGSSTVSRLYVGTTQVFG